MKSLIVLMLIVGWIGATPIGGSAQLLKNLAGSFAKGAAGGAGTGTASPANTAAAAAAVKEFMTASGGSGMLYQFQTRYDIRMKGKDSVIVDTMSSGICENRYTHVDMDMFGMKMTILGHVGQRRYSVVLYPGSRNYKLNVIDTARLNGGNGQTYQVTKVGAETVAGYSCIHSKLRIIGSDKKVVIDEDIWTSTAVPGYAQMKEDMANAHVTEQAMQALKNAGCEGFMVKASGQTAQMSFVMLLLTAERKNFPASMFEIPAGYTKMSGKIF